MEVITKSILKFKTSLNISIAVPYVYLKELGIDIGDRITIKPNINGYFLIQKLIGTVDSKQYNSIIDRYINFHLPNELMHKYRITNNHKVQFLVSKGRLIFRFNKPKDDKYI